MQTVEQRRLTRLAASYNTKARKLGIDGFIFPSELAAKPLRCNYCGIGLEVGQGTFDHAVPFDRGGTNTEDNIVRCCLSCNRRKFTKSPVEFAQHQNLVVNCKVCGRAYTPRWGEWINGRARTCSLRCAGRKRWLDGNSKTV